MTLAFLSLMYRFADGPSRAATPVRLIRVKRRSEEGSRAGTGAGGGLAGPAAEAVELQRQRQQQQQQQQAASLPGTVEVGPELGGEEAV